MKLKLYLSIISVFMFIGSQVSAQDAPGVVRSFACSVNDGYAMADVVEFARNIDWDEEATPNGLFFREALAVAGDFHNNWDFVISGFFADFPEMVEKINAQRNREGGRSGASLFGDMITCGPRSRIESVTLAKPGDIFEDTEATALASTVCELNGASIADAVARATAQGQQINAYSAVDVRFFGGNTTQQGSQVGMRFVFPNGAGFGESMEVIRTGGPNQPADGITCAGASLWVSHRIYSGN